MAGLFLLTQNLDIAEFFEKVAEKIDAKFILPWVSVELFRLLNDNKTTLDKIDIKIEHFVELLEKVRSEKITVLQGKQILKKFYPKSFSVKGIDGRIFDKKALEMVAREVINENSNVVNDYRNGEEKAFNYLMGEIMKKTNKRADFVIARKVLGRLLEQ